MAKDFLKKSVLSGLDIAAAFGGDGPAAAKAPKDATSHTEMQESEPALSKHDAFMRELEKIPPAPKVDHTQKPPAASVVDLSPAPAPVRAADLSPSAGTAKRKAGRPRLNPDRPLTPAEKAARYRKQRQAIHKQARAGLVSATGLSHIDLCHAVAYLLNNARDLELRQMTAPLVKELQHRLKNL